jgi:hypothetical protein
VFGDMVDAYAGQEGLVREATHALAGEIGHVHAP